MHQIYGHGQVTSLGNYIKGKKHYKQWIKHWCQVSKKEHNTVKVHKSKEVRKIKAEIANKLERPKKKKREREKIDKVQRWLFEKSNNRTRKYWNYMCTKRILKMQKEQTCWRRNAGAGGWGGDRNTTALFDFNPPSGLSEGGEGSVWGWGLYTSTDFQDA